MEFEGSLKDIRIEKLKRYQEEGRDPFVHENYPNRDLSTHIIERFEELQGSSVRIAGRIMSKRLMGKAAFIHIQDSLGTIQVYVRKDALGDEVFEDFKTFDLGDIIGVEGTVFKTKTEEVSVKASEIVLLTKSLQTPPEKYHGLKDPELRYRQRYLDLIVNPEVKEAFLKRTAIIKSIRQCLDDQGYLEVETPILTTVAGGAAAKPFLTHHNALGLDMQLRIANELYLKRLIVGGFDKVYEMGKMFRNEGISYKHNPEFTNVEMYSAYEDYEDMMRLTESVVLHAVETLYGEKTIEYQGNVIDFTPPWRRVNMNDEVVRKTGIDFFTIEDPKEARRVAKEVLHLEVDDFMTQGHLVSEAFDAFCEKELIQPTFVLHHPVEVSPLSKKTPDDPRVTQRFEAYVNGWEIANGFSEINDPRDQRQRFEAQLSLREKGDDESHPMDEDFINALEVGMPPTGGLGIGVDRLIMILTKVNSIRDILFFPTMKPIGESDEEE